MPRGISIISEENAAQTHVALGRATLVGAYAPTHNPVSLAISQGSGGTGVASSGVVRTSFCVPAVVLAAAAEAACFAPEIADGVIACGEAGCPPGMSCSGDGYCYADPDGEGSGRRAALAVANNGAPNRVYAYCGDTMREVWTADTHDSGAVAWGDFDGDGVLELAAADDWDSIHLYGFTGGGLELIETEQLAVTPRDLAWGDFDGDGDDDLAAAGGGDYLRVLGHDGGGHLDVWWSSDDWYEGFGLDATDADGDGREDLAVGVRESGNAVYESHPSGLRLEWRADTAEATEGVAWADYEGDGYADLAVANYGGPVRVYANRGEWFEPVWASPTNFHEAVSFADYDGDGDPDLAVGTDSGIANFVYRNDGADFDLAWSSPEPDNTEAIEWGDVDGDGDPDLFVGNDMEPSRLYENRGGDLTLVWSSANSDPTWDVDFATWDGGPDPCRL